jgi:hypothetical protein
MQIKSRHIYILAAAVASVAAFAWPHTWGEVFAPSFIVPAVAGVAATVAGILAKSPHDQEME